jgi:predicted nicotinamide N-methyase
MEPILPHAVTAISAHVRNQHGILILKNRHRLIRHLQKNSPQPTLHGHQIWQSGFMIMEYLLKNPLDDGQQVLDLGCGWGLLSIFCAKQFNADVTSLDADELVFPYLDTHATVNNVQLKTLHSRFADIAEDELLTTDVLLGGDICYWDGMVNELQVLIARALVCGVKKIIIADPGRETFYRLASHCKAHFNAQLLPWKLEGRRRYQGFLLIIDNPFSL